MTSTNEPQDPAAIEALGETGIWSTLGLSETFQPVEQLWFKLLYSTWSARECKNLLGLVEAIQAGYPHPDYRAVVAAARRFTTLLQGLLPEAAFPTVKRREELDAGFWVLKAEIQRLLLKQSRGSIPPRAPSRFYGTEQDVEAPDRQAPLVYLVDTDAHSRKYVPLKVRQHGYRVRTFATLDDFRKAFELERPAAIIADVVFPEGNMAGVSAISKVNEKGDDRVPVIYTASRGDVTARFMARRSGADAYLMKPVDMPALLSKLDEVVAVREGEPYRVLIIEPERMTAKFYTMAMQFAGLEVRVIDQAFKVMEAMMAFQPDAVIMEQTLPECTGIELTEMLRQEEAFVHIPILFAAKEADFDIRRQAINAGADDFLIKPVDKDLLIAMIKSRARRARALLHRQHYLESRDPVTGLPNRHSFARQLAQWMRTPTHGQSGAILIEIDHFVELRGILGFAAADLVVADISLLLLQTTSRDDLLARFRENSYICLCQRDRWEQIEQLAQDIHQAFAKIQFQKGARLQALSATVAVGLCRETSADGLMAELEAAAQTAARAGGNRVELLASIARLKQTANPANSELSALLAHVDQGRFGVRFQPIVTLKEGDDLRRFEVFATATDEAGERVAIAPLLQAAEQAGIMDQIDRMILRRALKTLARYPGRAKMRLFVKLSAATLAKPDYLLKTVQAALQEAELPGANLALMLPTAAVWQHADRLVPVKAELDRLGCRIGLDWFGERATDRQLLTRFPVDCVKLHRSVVARLNDGDLEGRQMAELIEAVHGQRAQVITGYIEDAHVLTLTWQGRTDLMQGLFIQEPTERMDYDFASELESLRFWVE